MTDYAARDAEARARRRRLARKRKWEKRLTNLLAGAIVFGGIVGLVAFIALFGALGIYIGWDLGVYNLAHAVHTHVGKISFWTAFGLSFAIGAIRRLYTQDQTITFDKQT